MKEFIDNVLLNAIGSLNSRKLTLKWFSENGYSTQYDSIIETFNKYQCNKLAEAIYLLYHNSKRDRCYCGNYTPFVDFNNGFRKYCSTKCSQSDPEQIKKRVLSFQKVAKDAADRRQKTNLSKYGVKNTSSLSSVKEKRLETVRKKYGVDNVFASEEIKQQIAKTNIEKYGTSNYFASDEFLNNENNINKLAKNRFYTDSIRNIDGITPLFSEIEYEGTHHKYQFKCNSCGHVFKKSLHCGIDKVRCSRCNKSNTARSRAETEIADFINDIGLQHRTNDRDLISPYEIDIIIDSVKLCIEYDGLFWHSSSDNASDAFTRNRHVVKTEMCMNRGYTLLHIFENEWLDEIKQKIWKSMIMAKAGIVSEKIPARKCTVVTIDSKTERSFLDNNHIQGYTKSGNAFAAIYNNEIVAVMSFGKSRFNNVSDYELIRYASKTNTTVIGGFSKLLSHFRSLHDGSIVSYANRRYSNGNVYERNGFTLVSSGNPSYFYFKNGYTDFVSRYKAQKHKLGELLGEGFDNNLSESENMYANGYRRIWDCGTLTFILK